MVSNMPMDEYRKHPAISKSGLDLIHRSPAHYLEDKLNPKESTETQIIGSAFHTYVLEPELFDSQYAVLSEKYDKRTKEGKAAWADFQIQNAGKITLEPDDLEKFDKMRDAIFSHSKAKNALQGGIAESCLFWQHMGDIDCKARPDYITPNGLIVDIKTCQDARASEFAKACANYRYHVQAAFYCEGYYQVNGAYPANFVIVAIEKTAPYAVSVFTLDQMMDQGHREFEADLEVYAECLRTNTWPAYPEDVTSLILPRWAMEAA